MADGNLMFVLFLFGRTARETRNQHLEKLFGSIEVVPFSDRPCLEVKLPEAVPEAFEMVLKYIYTDRIDCKLFRRFKRKYANQEVKFLIYFN